MSADDKRAPSTSALRHFSASLPMMLLRAREAVMLRFRPMLRANGLTEQQWRVLRALASHEAIEVSRLARTTFLLGPSLSRIIPDLERQAFVRVDPDARDQRRKLVRLTPEGAAIIDKIAPLSEAIYADIAGRFGARRLAELEGLLVQLEDDLVEPAPDGAAEPGAVRVRRQPRASAE